MTNSKGRTICGADTRKCSKCEEHRRDHKDGRSKERCRFKAKSCESDKLLPNGRCRMHGGTTPNGLALPQTVNGRWSRYLPSDLILPYGDSQLLGDRVLDLVDEVNLVDALIAQALQTLNNGGGDWQAAGKAFREMETAGRAQDQTGIAAAADRLRHCLQDGRSSERGREEVGKLLERRRRLVDSERSARIDEGEMIATVAAVRIMQNFMNAVLIYVTDQSDRAAISDEFSRLVGRRSEAPTRPTRASS